MKHQRKTLRSYLLGDWNARIGKDSYNDWKKQQGIYCNELTNDRGLRLLEFASYNDLVVANTLGKHKKSRTMTWHHPNHINQGQIDYILVQNRFKSSVNIKKTRTFPKADIASPHDLVMMSFKLRLRNMPKPSYTRLKFDLDKLKDPLVAEQFKAAIGGKFAPLLMYTSDNDLQDDVDSFETITVETASDILGKKRSKKKPWITSDILDDCDKRRLLKQKKKTENQARLDYSKINKKIKKSMIEAKEHWIEDQCESIETNLIANDSKKAYATIKELTATKQQKVSTIKDKTGNILIEADAVHERWTEYCKDLYNTNVEGDADVLDVPDHQDISSDDTILKDEIVDAIKSLKKDKSPGVDNIPGELIQAGGDAMVTTLWHICNKVWKTKKWPKSWTQSLVLSLPKKGDLQVCSNYRTLSLISHPSKVLLRIILNRLKTQAAHVIAEEQAGFMKGRSTIEQVFNLRILCEKYLQHQQPLYHVFIDFKKAFDRVWHAALWATMRKYNISYSLIALIQELYSKASSAVYCNGTIGDWFMTTVGVRQGCLLSPTLFNIFLERIMTDALEGHTTSVTINGRPLSNLRFADDIDGLAGSESDLIDLITRLDESSRSYGMLISAEKTKIMANNNTSGFTQTVKVKETTLEAVDQFKYLGAIITDEGSKTEVLSRIAQSQSALAKLKTIWNDKNITLKSKIRLLRSLVISIFLYACETWTLTAEIERRVDSFEMRTFRQLLGISYKDHVTNETVRDKITEAIGKHQKLLDIVKTRKLKFFGHTTRSKGLSKTILQGTVQGRRKQGRQKKKWQDNITTWTGLSFAEATRAAEDRDGWRCVVKSALQVPQQPP